MFNIGSSSSVCRNVDDEGVVGRGRRRKRKRGGKGRGKEVWKLQKLIIKIRNFMIKALKQSVFLKLRLQSLLPELLFISHPTVHHVKRIFLKKKYNKFLF